MADSDGQIIQGQSKTSAKNNAKAIGMDKGLRNFLIGIYQKMALGLVVTGMMAWAVSVSPTAQALLYRHDATGDIAGYTLLGWVFALAPLGLSIASGFVMRGLNVFAMALLYWAFVAIMGVSLSSIFLMYTASSLGTVFFVTAGAFGALSLAGYSTKINMTGWGAFLGMAVIGLLIASVVNIFMHSGILSLVISAAGVLIFSALIAYKTQWLKQVYYSLENSHTGLATMTYYGALNLYISFINLFLSLLRLMGSRR